MNQNVGGLFNLLDAGQLVLPARPVIECTEWGARSCNMAFKIYNRDFPRLDPCYDSAFGTSVGVKRFAAPPVYPKLAVNRDLDLSYLGAQSSRFTRNGGGQPGVGLLEVLYRGAVFALPEVGIVVANAAARIAGTTGYDNGTIVREADTNLYYDLDDNSVAAAASWHLVPILTPPWRTSGRTRSSVSIPVYTAGVVDGSAAVDYWAPEYTWRYVTYADFNAPIIAPFNVGIAEPTIIALTSFNAAGEPVANPSLGTMRTSRSIHFESVACGRYFECTETLQNIFIGNPPTGIAGGGGGETLVAEATEFIQPAYGGSYEFTLIYPVGANFTLARLIIKAANSTGKVTLNRYRPSTSTTTALASNITLNTSETTTTSFAATDIVAGDRISLVLYGVPPPNYQSFEWHIFKS